jgi:hypothetical protein
LHGPLKKNNKNPEKKIKFGPPPPGPLGAIFRSFLGFFFGKYGPKLKKKKKVLIIA